MYKNILVAISHGQNAYDLFQVGLNLALKTGAMLTLSHIKNLHIVLPDFTTASSTMYNPNPTEIFYYETNDGMKELLEKYKEEALEKGVHKVDVVITSSSTPALAITDVVAEGFECDLIICGESSRKKRFLKLFGNTANEIVKHAKCDVLVVKNKRTNNEEEKQEE